MLGLVTKLHDTQSHEDDLFQFVYPMLARAMNKGKASPHVGTIDHIKEMYDYLPKARILNLVGSIAKRSRWYDMLEMLTEEPIVLLATMLSALQQGRWKSWKDTPLYSVYQEGTRSRRLARLQLAQCSKLAPGSRPRGLLTLAGAASATL